MKSLPQSKIDAVLHHLDQGHSINSTARELNLGVSTLSHICRRHLPGLPKSLGGQISLMSEHDTRHAIRLITPGKVDNAVEVTHSIMEIKNRSISHQTVRRSLKRAGLRVVVKKKKPSLSVKQKKDHFDFARAHKCWTNYDWKRIIWLDETKINRLKSDDRCWTWKQKGRGLVEREVTET